jgi:mitogen-activated protein kinase kinase kinase
LTFTIDVDACSGGVEVIQKVLRKFGKGGARSADAEDGMDVQMENGGLSVEGWGVYMDDSPSTSYLQPHFIVLTIV